MHATSYRAIAARFGLADTSLQRHEREHLRLSWQESKELNAALSAENLLAKLASLDSVTLELLAEARTVGDIRTALSAVRESRSNIEAYGRIGPLGDIEQRLNALEQKESGEDDESTPS